MIHAVSLLQPTFFSTAPWIIGQLAIAARLVSLARIHTAEGFSSEASTLHRSCSKLCVAIEAHSIDHHSAFKSVCLLKWIILTFVFCLLCEFFLSLESRVVCIWYATAER